LVGSWLDDVKLSFISTIVALNAAAFAKFSLKWFKLAGSWDANKTKRLAKIGQNPEGLKGFDKQTPSFTHRLSPLEFP
jgi:hypothetical protein